MNVTLSPDGRRAATASLEAGRLTIWVFDLERGAEEMPQIAGMNSNRCGYPTAAVVHQHAQGRLDVYVKASAAAEGGRIPLGPDDADAVAWLQDGRLVFQGSEPVGAYPLKLLDSRQPINRAPHRAARGNGGAVSPTNDRWPTSPRDGPHANLRRALAGTAAGVVLSRNSKLPAFTRKGRGLALVRSGPLVVEPWRERADAWS